ncbi:MAG: UDP-N-acetylmuramoyl-L-alanine--D-glutamate ligase, partial [Gammaproteobacteria bacterium]|nr:UDP-N-acetylmuramoyl-L-alanine--D-glutamate ligase [Gammaproteobacteria bacterium]
MMVAANRELGGKPVLVVGLGLTGWSVVRFLKSRGEDVVVADSREAPPYRDALETNFPDVPLLDWNR